MSSPDPAFCAALLLPPRALGPWMIRKLRNYLAYLLMRSEFFFFAVCAEHEPEPDGAGPIFQLIKMKLIAKYQVQ